MPPRVSAPLPGSMASRQVVAEAFLLSHYGDCVEVVTLYLVPCVNGDRALELVCHTHRTNTLTIPDERLVVQMRHNPWGGTRIHVPWSVSQAVDAFQGFDNAVRIRVQEQRNGSLGLRSVTYDLGSDAPIMPAETQASQRNYHFPRRWVETVAPVPRRGRSPREGRDATPINRELERQDAEEARQGSPAIDALRQQLAAMQDQPRDARPLLIIGSPTVGELPSPRRATRAEMEALFEDDTAKPAKKRTKKAVKEEPKPAPTLEQLQSSFQPKRRIKL